LTPVKMHIQPQASFLSTFTVHVHNKCVYRVFQSLKIRLPESFEVKKKLQTKWHVIKEHLCGSLYALRMVAVIGRHVSMPIK
jgi:hypothetical protein